METLFRWLHEEVALEGVRGCPVRRAARLLTDRAKEADIAVDDAAMAMLWRCVVRRNGSSSSSSSSSSAARVTVHDQRGRQLAGQALRDTSFAEACEQKMMLLAAETLQHQQILGRASGSGSGGALTDQQYAALCAVAQARRAGIVQPLITKLLNEDARSMFNIMKGLCDLGLVRKHTVLWMPKAGGRALRTALFRHWRFADASDGDAASEVADKKKNKKSSKKENADEHSSESESDVDFDLTKSGAAIIGNDQLRAEISQKVAESKNQVLLLADLTGYFCGKYPSLSIKPVRQVIRTMTAAGYLKRGEIAMEENGKTISRACVQFLKEFKIEAHAGDQTKDAAGGHGATEAAETAEAARGLILGLPVDYQIVKAISDAGSKGITTLEMKAQLFNFYMKITERRFEKLLRSKTEYYSITRTAETKGKQRENRYRLKAKVPLFGNYQLNGVEGRPGHAADGGQAEPDDGLQVLTDRRDTVLSATRRKNLLEMLEEAKILEVTVGLCRTYRDRYQESTGDTTLMDRKTILRLVDTLASLKQAKKHVVDFKRYTGLVEAKTLLVHNSLEVGGDEVQQFVANLRAATASKFAEVEKIEAVEIERLGGDTDEDEEGGEAAPSVRTNPWQMDAAEFGWLPAKMARARLFHIFLFDLLTCQNQLVTDPSEMWTFDASTLYHQITLGTYLKVIGYGSPATVLREYLAKGGNKLLPLSQLDARLRKEISKSAGNRPSRTIKAMLKLLSVLGIVHRVVTDTDEPQDMLEFELHGRCMMRLNMAVNIRDFRLPDRPYAMTYEVTGRDDINQLWTTLQAHSIQGNAKVTTEGDIFADYEQQMSKELRQILFQIRNPRNWYKGFAITPEQRRILEPEVDTVNFKTPLEDMNRCQELAEATGLSVVAVRTYYKRALERHSMRPAGAARTSRRQTPKIVLALETITSAADNAELLAEEVTAAALAQKAQATQLVRLHSSKQTRVRHTWLPEEDYLLVVSYVIVRTRLSRFNMGISNSWPIVAKCFVGKPAELCRRRFTQLRDKPEWKARIALFMMQWPEIYDKAVEEQLLHEDICVDKIKFDLMKEIEVFKAKTEHLLETAALMDVEYPEPTKKVKKSKGGVAHHHDVAVDESFLHAEDIEDISYAKNRFDFLCQLPLFRSDDHEIAAEGEALPTIEFEKTAEFIKMLLMMQDAEYDPIRAHTLVTQFANLDDVLTELKHQKVVVDAKTHSQRRRIPGRGFEISQRATACLKPKLSDNVFEEAKEFHRRIVTRTDLIDNADLIAADGNMLAILSLAVQERLDLTESDIKVSDGDLGDRTNPEISMNIQARIARPEGVGSATAKRPLTTDEPTPPTPEMTPKLLPAKSKGKAKQADADELMAAIQSAGPSGVPETTLRQRHPDFRTVLAPLIDGGQIVRVGYSKYVYVAKEHASQWYIKLDLGHLKKETQVTPPTSDHESDSAQCESARADLPQAPPTSGTTSAIASGASSSSKREVLKEVAIMSPKKRSKGSILAGVRARSVSAPNVTANQNAIIGRVWYSLSGRFQRALFQSLVDALLTNVVNHPGVSLDRLCQRFAPLLNRCEVQDVLEFMENQGAIARMQPEGIVNPHYEANSNCYLNSRVPPEYAP